MGKIKCFSAGAVAGMILAVLVGGWWQYYRNITHNQPSVEATAAPEIRGRDTATIESAPIRYFPGAKQRLSLAPSVTENTAAVVVAATKIGIRDTPHTVTAITDTGTGITSLFVRDDPLPWFRSDRSMEVGLNFGVNESGETGYRLDMRYNFLQIKAASLGLTGSLQDGRSFIGVGVRARW